MTLPLLFAGTLFEAVGALTASFDWLTAPSLIFARPTARGAKPMCYP